MAQPVQELPFFDLFEYDDRDVDMESVASSDISLVGREDDVGMAAQDVFDDDDDIILNGPVRADIGDCHVEDDMPLKYEDSLNVSIISTDRGFSMETTGSVPLHQAGHLLIMSRLEKSLPIAIVSCIVKLLGPQCLREITFSQMSLSGTVKDFEDFTKALCLLQNMEQLHLIDCCFLNDTGARPLDTILSGLACDETVLPKLYHLELYAVDIDREPEGSFVGAAALTQFIRNKPKLRFLNCEDLTLQTCHIIELAKALESHQKLEVLKLWGCAVSDEGMVAIARMLKVNSSILNLELSCNEIGNKGCIAVAKALNGNRTLKELRLVRNEKIEPRGKGYEALLAMTKQNHNIEELLLQPTQEVDSDLGFYLFVNRNNLLGDENISKERLVDLLFSHKADPTFLFLFLKAMPAICWD